MYKIVIDLKNNRSEIQIASAPLDAIGRDIKSFVKGRAFVVSDKNVFTLYGGEFCMSLENEGISCRLILIEPGERSKSFAGYQALCQWLAAEGITRRDSVIAFGGGVVGDLAGFAAATILRGVNFIQIPTSLLAQVDSSVGGKTAINLDEGKNLLGAFYQPSLVLINPSLLKTLPEREFSNGMAEVAKYGALFDSGFLKRLKVCGGRQGIEKEIDEIIYICCKMKADIVAADERESGIRTLLNFGHSLGHVYEKLGNYERYSHGEAIAAGMLDACAIGEGLGLSAAGTRERLKEVLECYGLNLSVPSAIEDIERYIFHDKKSSGEGLKFVFLHEIGSSFVKEIKNAELLKIIEEALYNGPENQSGPA